MNVGRYIDDVVKYDHRWPAVAEGNRELSYGQLLEEVLAFAGILRGMGIQPGDRVAIMLPNGINFVAAYLAILRVGGIVVAVNYMNRRYEVAHILKTVTPKALFVQERTFEAIAPALDEGEAPVHPILTDAPDSEPRSLTSLRARHEAFTPIVDRTPEDPAVIIFTSAQEGGRPRGATITHGNLEFSTGISFMEYGQSRKTAHLGVLPFFHSFGQTNSMLCSIRAGARIVMTSRFQPGEVGELIRHYGITHMACVPTMIMMLVASSDLDDDALLNLQRIVAGGAAMPEAGLLGFQDRFKVPVQEGYGLTEAAPTVSYMRMEFAVRNGSVGHPVPMTEVQIFDDDDKPLPTGEIGEVVIRGPHVFQGYWNDDPFTAKTLRGGWLHSGDFGFIDKDGFITLTGLKKEMYLIGGFNVYPEELHLLFKHVPEVESIEFYAEDDLFQGHALKARVKLAPGVQMKPRELRRRCMDFMSMYKVPREFEILE